MKQKWNTLSKHGGRTYNFLTFICTLMTGVFLLFDNHGPKNRLKTELQNHSQLASQKILYNRYEDVREKILYLLEIEKHGIVVPNKLLNEVREQFCQKHQTEVKNLHQFLSKHKVTTVQFKKYLQLEAASKYWNLYKNDNIINAFVEYLKDIITFEKVAEASGTIYTIQPSQVELSNQNNPKPKLNIQNILSESRSGIVTKKNINDININWEYITREEVSERKNNRLAEIKQQNQLYQWFIDNYKPDTNTTNMVIGINELGEMYQIDNKQQSKKLNIIIPEELLNIASRSMIIYKGSMGYSHNIDLMFLKHADYLIHIDNIIPIQEVVNNQTDLVMQIEANHKQTIYDAIVYCDKLNKGIMSIDQLPILNAKSYRGPCVSHQTYQMVPHTDYISILVVDNFHYINDNFGIKTIAQKLIQTNVSKIIDYWFAQ